MIEQEHQSLDLAGISVAPIRLPITVPADEEMRSLATDDAGILEPYAVNRPPASMKYTYQTTPFLCPMAFSHYLFLFPFCELVILSK
jgi:hypothetical protein